MKCGKPTLAEEAASVTRGVLRKGSGLDEEGRPVKEGSYTERTLRVENWYYDRGRHDFVYILTFVGGTLINIKTGGYGGRPYPPDGSAPQRLPEEGEESPGLPPDAPRSKGSLVSEDEKTEGFGTGKIDLVGTPYGARVYLDDHFAGNLPTTLTEVAAGSYDLLVSGAGYLEWSERIEVKAGATLWITVHLQSIEAGGRDGESGSGQASPPKKLFKWTDPEGRIHITDTPPPFPEGGEGPAGSN